MGDVNFRVVEKPEFEFESLIPGFVEQYVDTDIKCDDIRRNLSLNTSEFAKIRKEVIRRGLITGEERVKKITKPKYYHFSERYGKYMITKSIGGMKKYFFSCKTEEEAEILRDELVKVGWDKSKVDKDKILEEYYK